jgi:hypothetical protein
MNVFQTKLLRWFSDERAAHEIQEYVGRARLVIDTLTSRRYTEPSRLKSRYKLISDASFILRERELPTI